MTMRALQLGPAATFQRYTNQAQEMNEMSGVRYPWLLSVVVVLTGECGRLRFRRTRW
jgi:hypothetical protein